MSANSAGRALIAWSTADRSRTSSSSGSTRAPNSLARSASLAALRAEATTRAPSAAKRRAIPAPNPVLAPVTNTVSGLLAVVAVLPEPPELPGLPTNTFTASSSVW